MNVAVRGKTGVESTNFRDTYSCNEQQHNDKHIERGLDTRGDSSACVCVCVRVWCVRRV